jgi:2-polyprenyl-6-hydroxyphenyl methylase/3-demethylubiquinone-9 3-methyltransferase
VAEKQAGSGERRTTVDPAEVAHFEANAEAWWDAAGPYGPLHKFNPVRLGYIRDRLVAQFGCDASAIRPFTGLRLLDAGCGGGLIAEPMRRLGAEVVAIDASARNIAVARAHAEAAGLDIDYREGTVEELDPKAERFDAVLAMDVIEHVADPALFIDACATLIRPGGGMALGTLNRTLKAYALAIVGAEYVLRWLPRGSHHWRKFLKPSELARDLRAAGLALTDLTGVVYNPLTDAWTTSRDIDVNYMAFATKPGA